MDGIYLRYPDGQRTHRSEAEVRRLWRDGLMPDGTIYWQDGMTEWRPVSQWLGERPAPFEESEKDASENGPATYQFLRDPSRLTKFLQRLLFVSIVVACFALVDDLAGFFQLESGRTTADQLATDDPVQEVLGLLQAGLGVVTGITFLRWVYRAYKNIQGFGAENLKYSPGWAVGYYFMPILGLIRPVQVMGEIWRASENPRDWRRRPGSWLIGSWWALFLVYTVITQIALQLSIQASSNTEWVFADVLATIGDFISIPLSIAALRLVTEVFRRQKALVDGMDPGGKVF
jgi:hypothetical protein